MSLLKDSVRKDFIWAMRSALLEQCHRSKVLTESNRSVAVKFIKEEATYEQLLNLVYNPGREQNYLSSEILEAIVIATLPKVMNMSPVKEAKKKVKKPTEFEKKEEKKSEVKESSLSDINSKLKLLESILVSEVAAPSTTNAPVTSTDILRYLSSKSAAGKLDTTDLKVMRSLESQGKLRTANRMALLKRNRDAIDSEAKKSIWGSAKDSAKASVSNALSNPATKWVALGVVGAIAIATAAYFIYKRFYSAAAKACKGAKDRVACIKDFKVKSIMTTVAALEQARTGCSKAKNPDKCARRYAMQINKWRARLAKLQE